tara:strand:- start:279 stop:491 length:213 start_codon:yes stop_codon:yes gene_type:complete
MKILLTLIMCSYTEATCMPPYQWPEYQKDFYNCFQKGYEESLKKIEEIGRAEVNKHQIYIRFTCEEISTI